MRLFSRVPLLVATAVLAAAPAVRAEGVAWFAGSLEQAIASAKASNKRVMIDVYATWCGPCHELDAKVFSRPDVAEAIAKLYVPLRIDGEAGDGPKIVERFHTVGYPTTLFVDVDGAEIDRVFGSAEPAEFVKTAQSYAKGEGTLTSAEEAYFAGSLFDAKAAADISERWAVRGDLPRARFFRDEVERIVRALAEASSSTGAKATTPFSDYDRTGRERRRQALERPRNDALRALREVDFAFAKYGLLRGAKDYQAAVKALEEIISKHAGTDEADEAQYQLAYAWKGGLDRAKRALDLYVSGHAKEAGAYNSYAWFCFKQGVLIDDGIQVAKRGLNRTAEGLGPVGYARGFQFKAGKAADAVASAQRAAALAPDDAYFKAQLAKFSAK